VRAFRMRLQKVLLFLMYTPTYKYTAIKCIKYQPEKNLHFLQNNSLPGGIQVTDATPRGGGCGGGYVGGCVPVCTCLNDSIPLFLLTSCVDCLQWLFWSTSCGGTSAPNPSSWD